MLSACTLSLTLSLAPGGGSGTGSIDVVQGYATMGLAPGLGAESFTLEAWFRIDGPGVPVGTGYWGTSGAPILAKGRDEGGEGNALDLNYFMGIHPTGRLVVDLEDRTWGANHPLVSASVVSQGAWHHAAASYDGTTWRLYLDGRLESWSVAEVTPRSNSAQHFSIGSALNSSGVAAGFFNGRIDEVRIWDHARSSAEIRSAMNSQIEQAPGLIGRWGMNEKKGSIIFDSSGNGHDGTLVMAPRTPGGPFNVDLSADDPVAMAPAAGAASATAAPTLRVWVSDPDADMLDVTFFGRAEPPQRPGAFTLAVLPDTQIYVNFPKDLEWMFEAQTQWIVDHREEQNIAWVGHVGDIVNNDRDIEWQEADVAISILETLPDLPYTLGVGNHDETRFGNPDGTQKFNQYFPYTRYEGVVPWYGGHFPPNNDNSYQLFSAAGEDYIVVSVEYAFQSEALAWADSIIAAHPGRRAIVVSHSILLAELAGLPGAQAPISVESLPLWTELRDNPNLFLMLCGHVYGEGRRTEVYQGNTVHMLLADFQHRENGGNGWMRLLELAPGDDAVRVRTWSPVLDSFETDSNSDFWLGTPPGSAFVPLGKVARVRSGSTAEIVWPGLVDGQRYEWKVTVSDGTSTTSGPVWTFDVDLGDADLNGDGVVNVADLLILILNWGLCPGGGKPCPGDIDGNGEVDVPDLVALLVSWD